MIPVYIIITIITMAIRLVWWSIPKPSDLDKLNEILRNWKS